MRTHTLACLVAAAAAAACGRPSGGAAQTPVRPHYLAGVPALPGAIVSDTTGSPEAESRGYMMQVQMDSVVRFFRRELTARGWQTIADVGDSARLNLYLQRDSINLWIQIRRLGTLATQWSVTATGTATDTAAPARRP